MKRIALAALSSLLFVDKVACIAYHDVTVEGLQLKSDEPIEANKVKLVLAEATGSIGARTLSSLLRTRTLKIVRSKIDHIEDGAFCSLPKLHSLEFEDNEQFPILTETLLQNCNNIDDLILKNTEIKPDAFKSLINLRSLEVKNQNFDITKKNLEWLKNLEALDLKDCEIKQIDAGALGLSPRLSRFCMVGNTITSPITKSAFKNCNSLADIILENKNRIDLEEETFSELSNVRYVMVENVNITHLTKNYLTGLKTANYIVFGNANINDIDADAFSGFEHLAHLHLENNHLNKINFTEDLNVVITLYLNGNEFSEFDSDGIVHLPKLARLVLINNKLTSINNIKHPKLADLLVDGNNISEIDAKSLKENLPKLTFLSIKGNPMSPEYVDALKTKLEGIEIEFTERS